MTTVLTMMLAAAVVLVLVLSAFRTPIRLRRWSLAGLALIALLHILVDGFYYVFVPVYILVVLLIVIGLYQLKKLKTNKAEHGWIKRAASIVWRLAWRLAAVVLVVGSIITSWSFGKDNFYPLLFAENSVDYSELGWGDAFDRMNSQLAADYAFGDWKALDWNALHNRFAPQFATAEQNRDQNAYYLALREYVYALPDGHFGLYGDDLGLRKARIGGGFGLNVMKLDDGRVIASQVFEAGPAQQAGLQWGAEMLSWNAIPVDAALQQVSTTWFDYPIATLEGQNIQKQNLLTRAPVGEPVTLTFQNPGSDDVQQLSLTAVDDGMAWFYQSQQMGLVMKVKDGRRAIADKAVEFSILPNGYGYLKINYEVPLMSMINPVGVVRSAVIEFIKKDVPGVVIDVRRNLGGYDSMAPLMMAYFCSEPMFYEKVAYPDDSTDELTGILDVVLEPSTSVYTGPVAMLIDNFNISTGEGFPMIMQRLKRGPVIGFYGTYGSFGMSGSSIRLPGDYIVAYANGASLDEDGTIQLDSDSALNGGVLPDMRVLITEDTLRAIQVEGRDILLETAIETLQSKQKNN